MPLLLTDKLFSRIKRIESLSSFEVADQTFTTDVAISATTEGTATVIASIAQVSLLAAGNSSTTFEVEFRCPGVTPPASSNLLRLVVFVNGTAVGHIALIGATHPVVASLRTPAVAGAEVDVRGYVDGGSATLHAGVGGAGNNAPGYLIVRTLAS